MAAPGQRTKRIAGEQAPSMSRSATRRPPKPASEGAARASRLRRPSRRAAVRARFDRTKQCDPDPRRRARPKPRNLGPRPNGSDGYSSISAAVQHANRITPSWHIGATRIRTGSECSAVRLELSHRYRAWAKEPNGSRTIIAHKDRGEIGQHSCPFLASFKLHGVGRLKRPRKRRRAAMKGGRGER